MIRLAHSGRTSKIVSHYRVTMNRNVAKAISTVVKTMMDRVMDKVLIEDPFVAEKHHAHKPLHTLR